MTINDEILAIANQIANQGKKPSVALIKTKLTEQVPLPTIISVLKSWQHEPSFTQINTLGVTEEIKNEPQDTDIPLLINQAVAPLQQEIKQLKLMIQQLIDKTG